MLLLIVVLLLLAAMAGVLGAVLKATTVLVLSLVLAVVLLGAAAYYYVRYRVRRFGRDVQEYRERYLGPSGGAGSYPARGYRRPPGPDPDDGAPGQLPS